MEDFDHMRKGTGRKAKRKHLSSSHFRESGRTLMVGVRRRGSIIHRRGIPDTLEDSDQILKSAVETETGSGEQLCPCSV